MTVQRVVCGTHDIDVGGVGYAPVGDFNNQFTLVQLNQNLHRIVRERRALRGFDGVIQQVTNNRNQLCFEKRGKRFIHCAGGVEIQLDAFFTRSSGFPK